MSDQNYVGKDTIEQVMELVKNNEQNRCPYENILSRMSLIVSLIDSLVDVIGNIPAEDTGIDTDAIQEMINSSNTALLNSVQEMINSSKQDHMDTVQSMIDENNQTQIGAIQELIADNNESQMSTIQEMINTSTADKLNSTSDTKDNVVTFTSNDDADPSAWQDVEVITGEEKHSSFFSKVSSMIKNIRYIWKLIGSTDISTIGDGSITGAIEDLNNKLADVQIDYKITVQATEPETVEDGNIVFVYEE